MLLSRGLRRVKPVSGRVFTRDSSRNPFLQWDSQHTLIMGLNSTVLCSTIAFALVIAPKLRGIWLRMCIPKTVDLTGVTAAVSTERSGSNTFVTLDWSRIMGTLPFKIPFCSATLCDDGTIYVSGTIGLRPVSADGESQAPSIVMGGPMAEARRTMEIIEATLKACGATLENITMVHVYLVDNTKERFAESQRA